jgi:hypothetical protein
MLVVFYTVHVYVCVFTTCSTSDCLSYTLKDLWNVCMYVCNIGLQPTTYLYLLTHSMQHSPSWEASQEIPRFMEPESSLQHIQVPATCPCPEPTKLYTHKNWIIHNHIIWSQIFGPKHFKFMKFLLYIICTLHDRNWRMIIYNEREMEYDLRSGFFIDTVLIHITLPKRNHIQQNILLALHQIHVCVPHVVNIKL